MKACKVFICHSCCRLFESTSSDEEVIQELKENFGEQYNPEDCAVVCDDCYQKIMDERYGKG